MLTATSAFPDYYTILGVPRYTKDDGIRRAYLRRAWQYHPDLHPDDPDTEAMMTAVNVAYATLSDPAKRARYDVLRRKTITIPGRQHHTSCPTSGLRHRNKTEPGVVGGALLLLARFVRYIYT